MAQFEPLREGFRELNRMLTDRQAFNAQHEANQARSERQSSILASQLEDRAFGRAMQEKNMLLGMERDKYQKEKDTKQFNALTSQFNQQQRLREDQFAETQDVNKKDFNLKEAELDLKTKLNEINVEYKNQLKNKAIQDQQAYVDDNEKKSLMGLLNGTGFFDADPEIQQQIAEKLGAVGVKYDDNNEVIDITKEDGGSFQASNRDMRKVQPFVRHLLKDVEINTPKKTLAKIAEINARLAELAPIAKTSTTSMTKDVRFGPKIASVKQEINSLKKELAEIEPLAGPAGQIKDLEEKIDRTQAALAQQVRIGDPEAVVTEAELKALYEQQKVVNASQTKGKSKEKTVEKVIHLLDKHKNIIDTKLISMPAKAFEAGAGPEAGGNDHLKGWVFSEQKNMSRQEDVDRQNVFTAAAKRLYGAPEGMPGFVNPATQLLYAGLMATMTDMYDSGKFKHLSADGIAAQAPNRQAKKIGAFVLKTAIVEEEFQKGG